MITEKIDLYEYFHIERNGATGGLLTTYARESFADLPHRKRPAMLVFPGGGYQFNSEREGEPVAINFMQKGYSAFVLHYTVDTAYPVPLLEAAMGMIYIREQKEKYSVDPEHVGVVGFSAGGHLTGMIATMFDDENIQKVFQEKAALARPNAAILSYPVITTDASFTHECTAATISGNNEELRKKLSIENRVTKDSAPAFIWHTAEDDGVPVKNSLVLALAYAAANVPFDLHVFQNGGHGASTADIETYDAHTAAYSVRLLNWFPLAISWLAERGFAVNE